MFESEIDFLVCKERCKDLIREAEHDRLIQICSGRPSGRRADYRKFAGWLGGRIVKLGTRLQQL